MPFKLTHLKGTLVITMVVLVIICVALFYSEFKVNERNSRPKEKSTAAKKESEITTVRDLIAKSLSGRTRKEFNSRCPTYQEFRYLDFLHPVLKDKLCRNAEAYVLNSDGYPMCVLPNPFNEEMLNVVREESDIAEYRSLDNLKMLMFVYKWNEFYSALYKGGNRWEPRRIRWLLTFAIKLGSATFVDIGCNLGVYTVEAANMGLPTVSLDTDIHNLLRLRLTLNAAKLDASLVWNFVSRDRNLKYVNFYPDRPCDLRVGTAKNVASGIPVMPLRSEKLSSLIRSKIVVMKVDIEGGEIDFLMASGRLFTDFKVAAVQMEWHPPFIKGNDSLRMVNFFTEMDYKPWRVPSMAILNVRNVSGWGSIDVLWVHRNFIGMM